jgi:branched-chain amino acid transport system permease protein
MDGVPSHLQIFMQLVVSGAVLGMVYAVVAFGYHLTFSTSGTLNFGQGEALALGALLALALVLQGVPYLVATVLAGLGGAALGVLVERVAVRPARRSRSDAAWVMATIALGIMLRNVAENVWGREDRRFPAPLPEASLQLAGVHVLPMELAVVAGTLLLMLAVDLLRRHSLLGRAAAAVQNDPEAARLMGIDTGRIVTFSYALSALTAAFAGALVAPLTLAGPTMGAMLALKAFAVAIIGGLTGGAGVVAGGLLLGISETTTAFYVSTGCKDLPGLVLLLAVLALRPVGLPGRTRMRRT